MEWLLAALPYWEVPAIPLGPMKLQPFGILVATGVLFGAWVCRKRAEQLGVDDDLVRSLIGYTVIVGFIGAHVFDTVFYQWGKLKDDPLLILQVWNGISSYGGFLGAIAGYLLFVKVHKVKNHYVMADLAAWAILPGFTFGRMGCATVHDHPGALSDFFLAVDFPADSYVGATYGPGPRHDLGFYELLFLLGLNLVFWTLVLSKRRRNGFAMAVVAIGYAPVRFLLEPLRLSQTDPRFVGLTFAQWVSIALLVTGITLMVKIYRRPEDRAFSLEGVPGYHPEGEPPGKKSPNQKKSDSGKSGGSGKSAGGGKSGGSKKKKRK